MKTCKRCTREKDPEQFYADKSRRDGLSRLCKECTLKERTAYREANREKLRLGAQADRAAEPERGIWHAMIARCHNPDNKGYRRYGGRGITVCPQWRESYDVFLADVGPRPSPEHSIDRIEVNGNYEPGNVRWATMEEQSRNRTDNRYLTAFGKTQCMADWADELGLSRATLKDRLGRLGWSVEAALSRPARKMRRGRRAA